MFVTGISCRPFSIARLNRFKQSVSEHADAALFEETMEYVQKLRPKAVVIENVPGWDMKAGPDSEETCLQQHIEMFEALGTYRVRTFKLDVSTWARASRPRLYLVGVRHIASSHAANAESVLASSLAAERALDRVEWVIRKVLDHRRSLGEPQDVFSLDIGQVAREQIRDRLLYKSAGLSVAGWGAAAKVG